MKVNPESMPSRKLEVDANKKVKNAPREYTAKFSGITNVEELQQICRNYSENVRILGLAVHNLQGAVKKMRERMILNRKKFVENAHQEIHAKIHAEDMTIIPMANTWYRIAFLDEQIHGGALTWKEKLEAMRVIRMETDNVKRNTGRVPDQDTVKDSNFVTKNKSKRLPDLGIPDTMDIFIGEDNERDQGEEAAKDGVEGHPEESDGEAAEDESVAAVQVDGGPEDLPELQEGVSPAEPEGA